ncbi:GNAT family N-acetyltransferase [Streptomyces violaceusniger]|uniref:GCN5-related N-acetyltransferase n=1 Tax=Streptomyces violaceusniger (strain Tu 4113) TaxID=653045 RepID=G2PHY2_STRV4|nr:GNAT family N-acetyltransferase [Streptomyces violaceusniger]AEM88933.1 GCN5-related N-acetyltransferase [Streptomyces violaceusniger Tu 4113]
MSDVPFIRSPRMGDGPRLVELAEMALHSMGAVEFVKGLARQAERHDDDLRELRTNKGTLELLASVRVMDRGDGEVVGFSYCCPPMHWITQDAGAPSFGFVKRIAAALVEIEMIAVMPRYRRQGLARRLVADCEERYRAAGYRVAMVIAERSPAKLISWYVQQGYWFTQVEEPAYVRYWPNRSLDALYGHVTPTQRAGFKALVPGVGVEDAYVDAPVFRRETRYRDVAKGTRTSGIYGLPGVRRVQPLVQVSGLLG